MVYLMESPQEATRLLEKSDDLTTRNQLLSTGLKEGMTAVDAGGGSGFATKIMSDIVGPTGKVILLDESQERLDAAQKHCVGKLNIDYVQSNLEDIKLKNSDVDYLWCRFVFEYLQNPTQVFDEFLRISKTGAKIVVGDLDYNCMTHYPLAPHLEEQLRVLVSQLEKQKLWDPYAGRKLYSYFHEAGLDKIHVHFLAHHLFYGESDKRDLDNWSRKMDQMIELKEKGVIHVDFDIEAFRIEFTRFFENPSRFSYSPLILVEGVKV